MDNIETIPYFKLNKDYIQIIQYNPRILMLLNYIYFNSNKEYETLLTLNYLTLCLGFKLGRAKNSMANKFREDIDYLIQSKYIDFISYELCENYSDITYDKMFKLKIKNPKKINELSGNYVVINIEEFNKITLIAKKENINIFLLFNLYVLIKSYIYLNSKSLEICYPSIKTLCTLVNASYKTVSSYIQILEKHSLIYIYNFNENETIHKNGNIINYVYSIKKYVKFDVLNILKTT